MTTDVVKPGKPGDVLPFKKPGMPKALAWLDSIRKRYMISLDRPPFYSTTVPVISQ